MLLIICLSMDTPFELHVFWSSDTVSRIKPTFSESVSLSFKTRLMTLLNVPQEIKCYHTMTIKYESSVEEKVYDKQIINTGTLSDALHHISWIFPDLTTGWERTGQLLYIVDTSLSVLMTLRMCLRELSCLFTVWI